jgi:hypothetical protein
MVARLLVHHLINPSDYGTDLLVGKEAFQDILPKFTYD